MNQNEFYDPNFKFESSTRKKKKLEVCGANRASVNANGFFAWLSKPIRVLDPSGQLIFTTNDSYFNILILLLFFSINNYEI